jgi:hypothetical protein
MMRSALSVREEKAGNINREEYSTSFVELTPDALIWITD